MQGAVDTLMSRFKLCAAVIVEYADGGISIKGIPATVGRRLFDVVDGPVMIAHESRTYFIEKVYLVTADGEQLIPRSGVRITEADGRVYEVSVPKPFNVYESMGPGGSVFKIHTIGPVS
jgi:hypothetical protein